MSASTSSAKISKKPAKPVQKESDMDDLLTVLRSLYRQLRQANSLSLAFARGMMSGLGATVGVTVILGLLVLVVSQLARAFGVEAQPLLDFLR